MEIQESMSHYDEIVKNMSTDGNSLYDNDVGSLTKVTSSRSLSKYEEGSKINRYTG